MNPDPTIEELRAFINSKFDKLLDSESLKYDGSVAIYWVGNYFHSGQFSNLYSALCQTEYKPGVMISNIEDEDNESVWMIYNAILDEYFPDSDIFVVDTETNEVY